MLKYYFFIFLLGLLVIFLVITGFGIGQTPLSARLFGQDKIRLDDFVTINQKIQSYYRNNHRLPESLAKLDGEFRSQNPITKINYEYRIISTVSYNLCTNFSAETPEHQKTDYLAHKKGYDCIIFELGESFLNSVPTFTPTPYPIHPLPIADFTCLREVKNGRCVSPRCSFTLPADIYSQGKVIYGDIGKEEIFYDECVYSKSKWWLRKGWCAPSNDAQTNFEVALSVIECPNGCQDGACIK